MRKKKVHMKKSDNKKLNRSIGVSNKLIQTKKNYFCSAILDPPFSIKSQHKNLSARIDGEFQDEVLKTKLCQLVY